MITGSFRCLSQKKAEILSGVAISREMRRKLLLETQGLTRKPCLAVVLVGDRLDSLRYIRHKQRAAIECGIEVRVLPLPESVTQTQLHDELVKINNEAAVDGVILQLPLPPHLRARTALFHIHPGKDVDGLHPLNAGNLFLQDQSPLLEEDARHLGTGSSSLELTEGRRHRSHERKFFVPCTALAIRTLLFSYLNRSQDLVHAARPRSASEAAAVGHSCDTQPRRHHHSQHHPDYRSLHVVIVNRSMVVGIPTAALLQKVGGFMVTLCSRSNAIEDLQPLMRQADVLITAYGKAQVFDASFIKEGAVVIDAAINEVAKDHRSRCSLVGDVDIASASTVASAISQTPGGVGPLTVSHLMQNVVKAYQLRHANQLYYNNIYTEFLKMCSTHQQLRDPALPHANDAASSQHAVLNRCGGTHCDSGNEDEGEAANESYDV